MSSFARGFGYFAAGVFIGHLGSDNFEYETLAFCKVPMRNNYSLDISFKYPWGWKKEALIQPPTTPMASIIEAEAEQAEQAEHP